MFTKEYPSDDCGKLQAHHTPETDSRYNLTTGVIYMKNQKTRTMAITAMFTALITVMTAYFQIKTVNSGYIHFGDSMIYLASCLLPAPYAVFAASAGGALADILSGAAVWAVPTAIIKALNTVPFLIAVKMLRSREKDTKIISPVTVVMAIVSGIITIVGYWLAEGILFGFAAATVSSFLRGLVQPTGSAIIFYGAGMVLDKAKFKSVIAGH